MKTVASKFDGAVLISFLLTGLVWTSGIAVGFLAFDLKWVPVIAAYATTFSVALAYRRWSMMLVLLAAFGTGLAALFTLMRSMGSLVGEAMLLAGALGSTAFAAWVVMGFLLLTVLEPTRTTWGHADEPRGVA